MCCSALVYKKTPATIPSVVLMIVEEEETGIHQSTFCTNSEYRPGRESKYGKQRSLADEVINGIRLLTIIAYAVGSTARSRV